MRRTIILVPEAVVDAADAYEWYEGKENGLGDDFLNCLDTAYASIAEHPTHYPVRFDSFRRILLDRFPYAIYYEYDDSGICSLRISMLTRSQEAPPEAEHTKEMTCSLTLTGAPGAL